MSDSDPILFCPACGYRLADLRGPRPELAAGIVPKPEPPPLATYRRGDRSTKPEQPGQTIAPEPADIMHVGCVLVFGLSAGLGWLAWWLA